MLKLVQPGSMMTSGIEITAAGVIVGRERGCDLMLCSKNVSRQHARVVLQDKIACVEDLGSSNGTFVDGQPIKELTPLKPGCSVAFGDLTFFLIDDDPAVPRDPLSGDTNTSRRDPLPTPQPPAASIAESKPVRRFAIRAFDKEKATPPKSGPRFVIIGPCGKKLCVGSLCRASACPARQQFRTGKRGRQAWFARLFW